MAPPAKKSCQQFREEYSEVWPFLRKSRQGPTYAFCSLCNSDFSVAHSGRFDCKTHISSARHKKNEASNRSNHANIASMFKSISEKNGDDHATKVMRAEALMVEFIAENNLSLQLADKLPALIRKMCPDSNIAKSLQCARTKTTEVVKEMKNICDEELTKRMKTQPFTISTDGSNDMGSSKLFPLVIRTLSSSGDIVNSELLSVPVCEGSATAANIFRLIDSEFKLRGIPWENCLSLGCDNANVMRGEKGGVYSFCKEKNEHIYLAGCVLHLVHIAAEKGADCFPVSATDILVDIFYYFNKSSLRVHKFTQFQEFHGCEQKKLLKHVSTRWLSITKCLDRLLENWDALKEFFKEELKSKSLSKYARMKCEKILSVLRSRSTKLYFLFLKFSNRIFDEFLTVNQCDAPRIVKLQSQCCKLLRQFMLRFVKPSAFCGNKSPYEVDYKLSYNIKDNKDLVIGEECECYIGAKDQNGLDSGKISQFYIDVKVYFDTVTTYMKNVLPLQEVFLKNISIADPENISSASFQSVRYFAQKYPILLASASLDILRDEFNNLQSAFDTLSSGSRETERIDSFWCRVGAIKDETNGHPYWHISRFFLGLLTVPHSSAHCERIFSVVRKIQRDDRSTLGHSTLESLLVVKHRPGQALERTYTDSELRRLKSATAKSLNKDL